MTNDEQKVTPTEYRYYFYRGYVAREVRGNRECASNRFYFYMDGKWINDYNMSLHLSDAMMGVCDYSFFDYEALTEEEALRRISDN